MSRCLLICGFVGWNLVSDSGHPPNRHFNHLLLVSAYINLNIYYTYETFKSNQCYLYSPHCLNGLYILYSEQHPSLPFCCLIHSYRYDIQHFWIKKIKTDWTFCLTFFSCVLIFFQMFPTIFKPRKWFYSRNQCISFCNNFLWQKDTSDSEEGSVLNKGILFCFR